MRRKHFVVGINLLLLSMSDYLGHSWNYLEYRNSIRDLSVLLIEMVGALLISAGVLIFTQEVKGVIKN